MNETLVSFAAAFTSAVVVSWLVSFFLQRRGDDPSKAEKKQARRKKLSAFVSRLAFGVLGVGLVWTVYFLILGLVDKSQSEYAANSATLIVSVLTVFSIMIAFYEFLYRDKK